MFSEQAIPQKLNNPSKITLNLSAFLFILAANQ